MSASHIEQLGLSPRATRVLTAQMESALDGPAFWAGTIAGFVASLVFLAVGVGFLIWTVPLIPAAIEAREFFLAIPLLLGLAFSLVPLVVLPHALKVLKARRG